MGRLLRPKGLKGELRVFFFNEVDSALKHGVEIWLKINKYFSHKIEDIKIAGKRSSIKLIDCNTREQANALQGLFFYLPRDVFDPILTDEHYLIDIIESKVINENQMQIGIVKDVFSIHSQNIIVVKIGKDEILIPYVEEYIKLFDKKNKQLIVKDISGFII